MSDLIERLRVGAGQAKILNREPTAKLLLEAADGLEAAEARIASLTDALRELLVISDSTRPSDFTQIKQTLARARATLASPAPTLAPGTIDDAAVDKALMSSTLSALRGGM